MSNENNTDIYHIWERLAETEKDNKNLNAKVTALESALNDAEQMIEEERKKQKHLKHTINTCQEALIGQATLMGMLLEAMGDEAE
jgi:septal ring factor EnvC (AmiA/AmiB activator)